MNNSTPYIIAEVANCHDGNLQYIFELIDMIRYGNFDFIKFQVFDPDQLVTKDHPKYNSYVEKSFSIDEWKKIIQKCNSYNLKYIFDVFDLKSFHMVYENFNASGYKIHTTVSDDSDLIEKLNKNNNVVFLSASTLRKNQISKAIKTLNKCNVVLMIGHQNFPTKLEETHLNLIDLYQIEFPKNDIGLQDHVSADDFMSKIVPFMAYSKGCKWIEKHVNLDRSMKKTDYYSSLNPKEFCDFCMNLKRSTKCFGKRNFDLTKDQKLYLNKNKKYAVYKTNLSKNHIITLNDVCFKRTKTPGILREQFEDFFDKKLIKKVKLDQIASLEDFQ